MPEITKLELQRLNWIQIQLEQREWQQETFPNARQNDTISLTISDVRLLYDLATKNIDPQEIKQSASNSEGLPK